nr:HNH endonuclease [Moritella viscosa]SHO03669.1 Spore coat protein, CotS family [Moritella viscosa]
MADNKNNFGKVIPPHIYNNEIVQDKFIDSVRIDESTPQNIIDKMGKCWVIPNRMVSQDGYVRRVFSNAKRGTTRTEVINCLSYIHRMSYSIFHGTLPEYDKLTGHDYTVDHMCGNRGCCNPDHLQAVLRGENSKLMHKERVEHRKNDRIKDKNELKILTDSIESDNNVIITKDNDFLYGGDRDVIKSTSDQDWYNSI